MASKKVNGLTIAIDADTKGVTNGLKDISTESVKLSNNLKAVDSLLKLDPGNTDLIAERQKLLAQNIDATSKKLEMLKDAQDDVNAAFESGKISDAEYVAFQKEIVYTQKRLEDLTGQMSDLSKESETVKTPLEKLSGTISDQKAELERLSTEYQSAVLSEGKDSEAAVKLETEYKKLNSELKENQAKLDDAKSASASLSAEEKKALSPVDNLKKSISDQKDELERLTEERRNAVLTDGKNSDSVKNLDAKIKELTNEISSEEKQLESLDEASDEASKSTEELEKDTSALSDTLKNGLVAGAEAAAVAVAAVGAAAVAAVKGIVDLANETAELGDSIDKSSQKMGISAEAYQEWDFILQHNGASVDNLQAGIKTLSKQMVNAKSVIDGTTLADEELENQLASGEITLEEYNKAYDELYESAYQGIDAFQQIGYSMNDLEQFGSTEEMLADVISRLQEMPEGAERTVLATSLLGKSAIELGALLNSSAEDTETLRQQLHEMGGVMSDEAVKNAAAYEDSLQNMQTAITGIKNGIASNFIPSITTVMDGITGILSGSEDGIETVKSGIEQFASAVTDSVDDIKNRLSGIMEPLLSGLESLIPNALDIGVGIVMELANGLVKSLPTVAKMAVDIAVQISDGILSLAPKLLDAGTSAIMALSSGLSMALPRLLPMAVEAVTTLAKGFSDSLPDIIDSALLLINGLADGILVALPVLLRRLPAVIDSLVNGLLSSIPQIIETGIALFTALVDALPDAISSIVEVLPQVVTSITSAFMEHASDIMSAGYDLLTALIDNLPGIIGQLITAIPLIVASVLDAIYSFSPQMAEYGENLFTQLIERGTEIREKIVQLIPKIVSSIGNAFMDKYNDLQSMGMNIFDNVAAGVRNVLSGAWNWGADLITNFVNGITSNISAVVSAATSIGQTIKDYIGFSEPDKGPLSNFHTFAPDMMQLFADGIKDNTDVVANQFNRSLSGMTADATMGLSAGCVSGFSGASSAPIQLNVNVNVGSIASDYDVNRMTDHMIENISEELANLRSRQSALVGVM